MKYLRSLKNWVFPEKCISCGAEIADGARLCDTCFSKVVFIDFPYCQKCGKLLTDIYSSEMLCKICFDTENNRYFNVGRSLFHYNEISKRIIMRIKKEADESVAKVCASMLYSRHADIILECDVIVPVPSHISRLLRRGFNPPAIIAKYISTASSIRLDVNILKRSMRTEYQKGKDTREREKNVFGAFKVLKDVNGKKILLVDDVMTTGATISECSRALKLRNCSAVNFLTIGST